ncbi:hypothetical protein KY290_015805 [Solanum tuberosum]|uniref:Uncharacterized protein n=1 Tax=Solanum tuberosum TaxID=4113 RepID=A0ABQ7VVP1_SOLTU|nr:hypothetical protein KY285_012907 [Solanum tuberosum]KAH0771824.1 hypothetical protein KY290_015805 [Solanum tuberosum]
MGDSLTDNHHYEPNLKALLEIDVSLSYSNVKTFKTRTHTGGSISIGEHHKKLAIEKGRDLTPSELHLHVHTHGHDGKSFVGERSRIVHENINGCTCPVILHYELFCFKFVVAKNLSLNESESYLFQADEVFFCVVFFVKVPSILTRRLFVVFIILTLKSR